MADIPVHRVPVVDPDDALARHVKNLDALGEVLEALAIEIYPNSQSVAHDVVHQQRERLASTLRALLQRWLLQFVSRVTIPDLGLMGAKATRDERATALRAALNDADGPAAHFTSAPRPREEDRRMRALDVAAAMLMVALGASSDSPTAAHLEKLIDYFVAGPHMIAAWQHALQSQFELAPVWLRDGDVLTPRAIAMRICARVAAVPGAPTEFARPTMEQLDGLAAVVRTHLRPDGRSFRIPLEAGAQPGGAGSGRTASSWQIASEFAAILDLEMPREWDAKRPVERRRKPRKRRSKRSTTKEN